MEIVVDDLTGAEIAAFIAEHIEEMKAVARVRRVSTRSISKGYERPTSRFGPSGTMGC
jgi:hypothetical protein